MLNIKFVEELTGITKQNIRYYEKKGLLSVKRNTENSYREYDDKDIYTLKVIKLLRKLDMPIEEIRKVLGEEISLSDAISKQKAHLEKEKEKLQAAISFCDKIEANTLHSFDVDKYLATIEVEEKNGSVFADIFLDFKKLAKEDELRKFTFRPDTMCMNPAEFTEELLKYAEKNHLSIFITKESMYPEFELNGIEYMAYRELGRFGANIICKAKNTNKTHTEDIPKRRKILYLFLKVLFPTLIILLPAYFMFMPRTTKTEIFLFIYISILLGSLFVYNRFKK
ncbi:MerR family transcriptional regulator [Faecalimonas sp.]